MKQEAEEEQQEPLGIGSEAPALVVVDDEPDMASMIAEIGEFVGFTSREENDVRHFLATWDTHPHDVIVIDLFMPDTDGFELIDELVARSCNASIIMVSGYDPGLLESAAVLARTKGLKVCGTFPKPFFIDDIEGLLRELFKELTADAGSS